MTTPHVKETPRRKYMVESGQDGFGGITPDASGVPVIPEGAYGNGPTPGTTPSKPQDYIEGFQTPSDVTGDERLTPPPSAEVVQHAQTLAGGTAVEARVSLR
jgi:hypothetical protein